MWVFVVVVVVVLVDVVVVLVVVAVAVDVVLLFIINVVFAVGIDFVGAVVGPVISVVTLVEPRKLNLKYDQR